jgi:L-lactate dehydrogenase complex protein LldG
VEDRLDLFARRAAELRARFEIHRDLEGLGLRLRDLARAEGWRRVATHAGVLTVVLAPRLGVPILAVDRGCAARDLERCDAGLTECDALVAQTGSVLVTSRGAGGRALSALPPLSLIHI